MAHAVFPFFFYLFFLDGGINEVASAVENLHNTPFLSVIYVLRCEINTVYLFVFIVRLL